MYYQELTMTEWSYLCESSSWKLPLWSQINSKRRTQNPSKSLKKNAFETKGRQYISGKVIQRLFKINLYSYLAIYHYI